MDALRSLVQPLVGGGGGSSIVDGVKLVVLGTTVETARRVSSSAWSHFVNSFFLTAHFSEEDYPYDWLMLWLSRRPEWQRSREFETTTRTAVAGPGSRTADNSFGDEDDEGDVAAAATDDTPGKVKTRVVFQPTFDSTHTIYYRGHWLRVKRSRNASNCEVLSISVVARNNSILKQLVLQAKREYEAESVHRIQIYFADSHGSWRWTDSRHKRPMSSIVLNQGVKEMLLNDTKDFLRSEKWYADRGIPFRRGYLLYGVPGSGKSSLIHAIAGELMLDIYVVSLSSSWISDSTLTTLMGRVPARCIVLLEDLDAAFTRSTNRDDGSTGSPEGKKDEEQGPSNQPSGHGSSSRRHRHKENISDTNTLTLSGLLNALDGVAAAEGRLLFATTNHLERLDPALSRPGRMDVWIEFRNASRWQAEQLFSNFFPSADADPALDDEPPIEDGPALDEALAGVELKMTMPSVPVTPGAELKLAPSGASMSSLSSLPSVISSGPATSEASSSTFASSDAASLVDAVPSTAGRVPPEEVHAIPHSAPPLSGARLAYLAKRFAASIPEEEFSVAALQGYLLKNKSRPEQAADEAAGWVQSERELRERLKREKAAREAKERLEREKKKKEEAKKKAEEEAKAAATASANAAEAEPKVIAAAPTPAPEVPSPSSSSSSSASGDGKEEEEGDEEAKDGNNVATPMSASEWTAVPAPADSGSEWTEPAL